MTTQNICNICGANYEYLNGRWRCPACGAYKAEELSNEEVTLLYSANQKLRLSNFFEAEEEYTDIIEKYPLNPNGYWGRLLAKCGIKYEEDFDGRKIPTCYAASIESVIKDSDYLKAIELTDAETRQYFVEQAEYIERVCQEWLNRASKEKPYDVFICYKDSDLEKGIERTQDSIDAHEIYTHLLEQGYRVFFSRESLRDKVGEKYEPYIFNALSTAKVMLVYGSSADYIKSTWLKNEWHRFYKKVEAGEKHHDALLVACSGFSPNELPKILSSRQCFDARRKTFFIDLDKSIKRIIQETVSLKKTSPKESTITFSGIHEHKYTEIAVPATCIAKGYTIHRCDCGYEYRDSYTPLVDHSFNVESRTNPTCTSNGVETKACKVCGESITTTLPALGHQFTPWTECTHPTCTEDGEAQRQCKRCGTTETKTVPQTGHQFTRWSEFPTETSYCVNCGLQKTRKSSNRADATITNDGANATSNLITSIDAYGPTIASKLLFNIYTTFVELIEQSTKKSCFKIAIADIASFEKLPMLEVIRVKAKDNKQYDIKFGWPKRTQEAVRELSKLVVNPMANTKKCKSNSWNMFYVCLFLGILGVHNFLEKKIGRGLLYLFTFGQFYVGWIDDCVHYYRVAKYGINYETSEEFLPQRRHKAFVIGAYVCGAFSVLYFVLAIFMGADFIPAAVTFLLPCVILVLYYFSPRNSRYLFGLTKGIKKKFIIPISLLLYMIFAIIWGINFGQPAIQYQTFEVNGLSCSVPTDWEVYTNTESPFIMGKGTQVIEDSSAVTWYISYNGEYDTIDEYLDAEYTSSFPQTFHSDYELVEIEYCSEAYVFDETADDGQWRAVDYFVVCNGSVFKLQYYSIDGHFDESELEELLKRIDFESYSKAH